MAKPLAQVLAFPTKQAEVLPFPISQLCGCGCGILLNKQEDAFIISEEMGQWYVDEYDFLKGTQAIEHNGLYHFKDDNTGYWYKKSDFYEELSAYWINALVPIA